MTDYTAHLRQLRGDSYDAQEAEIKKLKKMNRMLLSSAKRTMEADWKNKFYALEEEALKENADLKRQIQEMKPASTKTNNEWGVVFEAMRKEIAELKEKIADWELAARSADFSDTPEELCNYLMYCGEPEEYNDLIKENEELRRN